MALQDLDSLHPSLTKKLSNILEIEMSIKSLIATQDSD